MQLTDYTQQTPIVGQALANIMPGRVLDIGSHEGRNALNLARQGWEVVAIDTDRTALTMLQKTADHEKLQLTTMVTDVRNYKPAKTFDAVLCLMVLHFLPEKDIATTIENIQRWTKPDGINVITAFTEDNPIGTRPYLFPKNGLHDYYQLWNIRSYEESFSSWIIPEGMTEPARYAVARLIAERPMG